MPEFSVIHLQDAHGNKDVAVAHIAVGLMGLTWRNDPVPDERAFAVMKAAVDAQPAHVRIIFNSATFYGPRDNPTANVSLLGRFFAKYPDYADRVFLAVKGGVDASSGTPTPNSKLEFLRKQVEFIQSKLGKAKKLDCLVIGRIDKTMPIETAVKNLKTVVDEGLITHIAISEASANTVRRAAKAVPLALHEFEYSPVSLTIEEAGILQASKDCSVPIMAYSPTGRGLLTGALKSLDDIPQGDVRRTYNRFQPQHFDKNLEVYQHFEAIAKRKHCTTSQLSIAWVMSQGKGICIPLTGSSRPEGVKENLASVDVHLDAHDLADMRKAIDTATPSGDRGSEHGNHLMAADTPEL